MSVVFLPRTSQVDAHDIARAVSRLSVVSYIAEEDEEDDDDAAGRVLLEDISTGTVNADQLDQVIATIQHSNSFKGSTKKPPSKLRKAFGKFKKVYDKYGLKHISPLLFLMLYSLIGAGCFCAIEQTHEAEELRIKKENSDAVRENTVKQLEKIINSQLMSVETKLFQTRDLILWYEEKLNLCPPPSITWDMWGALFYVGTIYTTIGYGNIYCSTTGGRILTIFYAMIGIPLVLAILSDLGSLFCKWINSFWRFVKRRLLVPKVVRRTMKVVSSSNMMHKSEDNNLVKPDEHLDKQGNHSEKVVDNPDDKAKVEEDENYQHVPVSLALAATFSWLFFCSSLFLLWETEWSYFQAIYFFFISLSTIGLGDIVPSHPRLMVTNFGLVIIGLSLVSMLISVIQQNFESWLYRVLQMIKEEYQAALEAGLLPSEDDVVDKVISKQPWYLRKMAPVLMTQSQKKHLAEIISFKQGMLVEAGTQCTSVKQVATRDESIQVFMAMSEMYSQTDEEEFETRLSDTEPTFIAPPPPVMADTAVQTAIVPSIFLQDENEDVVDMNMSSCVSTKDEGVQVTCSSGVGGLTIIEASFATNFVDAIVQTDDSYLKLAKKLEALKVNRAKSLAVWASPVVRKQRPAPMLESTPE